MLQSCDVVAFAAPADLNRAREFCSGALGLRLVERNDLACMCGADSFGGMPVAAIGRQP